MEQANAVLKRLILEYNRRFAVAAAVAEPAWRQPGQSIELERACSFGYQATVLNDNTVRIHGAVIDLGPGPQERSYAHARVEVRQLLDGSWRVYYRDQMIGRARQLGAANCARLKDAVSGRRLPPQRAPPKPKTHKIARSQTNKERAGGASSALASTNKLSGALHRTAGANSESSFSPALI